MVRGETVLMVVTVVRAAMAVRVKMAVRVVTVASEKLFPER